MSQIKIKCCRCLEDMHPSGFQNQMRMYQEAGSMGPDGSIKVPQNQQESLTKKICEDFLEQRKAIKREVLKERGLI